MKTFIYLTLAIELVVVPSALAENVLVGTNAGASITSGDANVLVGENAGTSQNDESYNTMVGYGAGEVNSYNSYLVCIGLYACSQDQSPLYQTVIGTRASYQNSGNYGVYLGYEAGYSQTDMDKSVYVGSGAGYYDNFTGTYQGNTYLGYHAGYNVSDRYNVAVGSEALKGNSEGVNPAFSVALGYQAALGVYDGDGNVALGEGAGHDLGSGDYNTLIGARAGEKVQDTSSYADDSDYFSSTFVGALSGLDSASGAYRNAFLGAGAASVNQTGDDNVVIGAFADFGDWSQLSESDIETLFLSEIGGTTSVTALDTAPQGNVLIGTYSYVSGDYNTVIGYGANSTGGDSLVIGSGASASHSQSVTIGYGASSHEDYGVVLGNSSTVGWEPNTDVVTELGSSSYRFTNLYSQSITSQASSGSGTTLSLAADAASDSGDSWQFSAADSGDFAIANDISGSQTALLSLSNAGDLTVSGDVTVLSDVRYKTDIEPVAHALSLLNQLQPKSYHWNSDSGRDEKIHFGLIAQQVEQLIPEVVTEDSNGWKSVAYPALLPLLAQAGGEIYDKQNRQAARLERIKQQLKRIEQKFTGKRSGNE